MIKADALRNNLMFTNKGSPMSNCRISIVSAAALAAALIFSTPAAAVEEDRVSIRTELQVAMQRHVDRNLVAGAVLHIDLESGALKEYFPTAAHPMIMASEDYFVVCADLVDAEGNQFDVDYYLAKTERGYKVVRTEIDNRSELKDLVSAGLVEQY